ncbi:hypothetical protein HK100_009501 [Physocladia obscura]|uniref:Uncharacterized protein n=1 Tax=Physocladia obscura TaxID=109957 RepID=A0AAD5XI46_9FUNG|nr:hypothetical protein HK100_009501 [Physocladia obscura]
MYVALFAAHRKTFGENDNATLRSQTTLQISIPTQRNESMHDTLAVVGRLRVVYLNPGKFQACAVSSELAEELVSLMSDDLTLTYMENLGLLYEKIGYFEKAKVIAERRVLALQTKLRVLRNRETILSS